VETGDIVLVALREYEKDKADIIHKYYTGEATHLIRVGEIPDSGTIATWIILLWLAQGRSSMELRCMQSF
jgi:hypothetical protein